VKKLLFSALLVTSTSFAAPTTTTSVGEVYTDASGKSLYTFSKDPVGKSVCTDQCEKLWPPVLVTAQSSKHFGTQAGFSQITREDGNKQWALNGKPLYRWLKDSQKGEITGAGIKGVWPLARADDVTIRLFNDGKQRYLVDSHNKTLYTFDKDKPNQSVCYDDCASKWPPALVDTEITQKGIANLKLTGGFGVTQRNDDSYQWTYHNKPLYRWIKDQKPGDTSGNGVKQVWHIVEQ